MPVISHFQIDNVIYESENSLVYRGHREVDNLPVVLKMLKQDYPPPEKIAWFRREYERTRGLNLPGVVDVYGLETDQHRWFMVLEDFGGDSLDLRSQRQPFTPAEFLPLAIQIVDILGQVHQQHVIHKDLNPSNIVLNPATGQLKIIDFGISTTLSQEIPTFRNPHTLEGTLAYISPEQTGRMNRTVDYRTDFYSLGVTLYELLTGQLPFASDDIMELVHAHIARQPTPPCELNPALPQPLSDLILKLMAKNAEDRYQSAYGLKADLDTCLYQWQTTGHVDPFPLGRHDVSDRFQIPQKLYGREREMAHLLAAFERVSQGAVEMMLIAGYAGVGKSALVQEIYRPITRQRGFFVTGKFDQLHRDVPYAPLIQALRAFVRQLLSENEAQIARWRDRLQAALGPNGQVVIQVIPEVELLIGTQPGVPVLAPSEAQNRFNFVLQNFVFALVQPEHPVVLFLDDLQWADAASLQLLQLLMTTPDCRHLFVVGAYRDNEVSGTHPLLLALDKIRQSGVVVDEIVLAPLDLSNVNQLIADALISPPEATQSLAELVLSKTGGNPFFTNEFLKSLYAEKLLTFDFQRGTWQWDVGRIKTRSLTDNVVELMRTKARKLPEQTRRVLELAACIGNRFDLQTLAIVSEKSVVETAADLWEALAEGLILPLDDAYKLMEFDVQGLSESVTVAYKFAHDRIQQAVYALIPTADKQTAHLQVGQLLLRNTPPEAREQNVFDIVDQLNLAIDHCRLRSDRDELAELNFLAGSKAKMSAAYQAAYTYLQTGIGLLGAACWERQYALALALHVEAAEAACFLGCYDEMQRLLDGVRQQAKTVLDKASAFGIEILSYSAQARLRDAVKVGIQMLEMLGTYLPEQPSQEDVLQGLEEIRLALAGKQFEALINLPKMTDPIALATMDALRKLTLPTYNASPNLNCLINLKMVSLSLEYGNMPLSVKGYVSYGLILCNIVGDIDAGYRFGNFALRLISPLDAKEVETTVIFIHNNFIRHWKEHIKETIEPFLGGYQRGLESGDIEFACFNLRGIIVQSYWCGKNLPELEREAKEACDTISRLKQEHSLHYAQVYWQAALNLMGQSENPCLLIGEAYDEETMLPLLREVNDMGIMCNVYCNKAILCYLFQKYDQAVEYLTSTEQYIRAVIGTMAFATFHFYDSLTRLAVWPQVEASEQEQSLVKVAANQEKLQQWAQHAPMNFQHKWYLVEAERARILGNAREARELYDNAIALAQEHGFVQEEALANELAGKFYLARGQHHVARHYLQDAHYAYQRWGAVAKVEDLETCYPQFLLHVTSTPRQASRTVSSATGTRHNSTLDLTSVLKASQAIASEIILDKLLDKLMNVVIENAGAQRGVLILEKEGRLLIEAEKVAMTNEVGVLQAIPVETRHDLPMTLIRYVERTKENVVLSNAAQEGMFTTDPYMGRYQPKSVLCMPLVNQGQLTGILYLENHLTADAFTSDRLAVLNLLTSQEAISIENANLYRRLQDANTQLEDYSRTLEQRVADRTHELHEKNQELEIANQQILAATERKIQFFNNMSHELRTPLDAVIGFSEVLQEQAVGVLNDKQAEYVNYILTSGTHLLSLINAILDLAKFDAGMIELQIAAFPLKPLLTSSLVIVQERAQEHRIALSLDVAEDIDAVVGDELRVKQILINLLSNAVKFTPDHGKVGIKATRVANSVQIDVWDTGVGIVQKDQQRIFEEFQQVGDAHVTTTTGTGLGLALTKKFVELHGGTIEVKSSPGRGSTFTFSLPVAETWHPASEAATF